MVDVLSLYIIVCHHSITKHLLINNKYTTKTNKKTEGFNIVSPVFGNNYITL